MTALERSLLQHVQTETEICGKLIDLLQQEEQLLIANELDPLMQLSQSKSQLVGQFALASQARYTQLQRADLPAEDRGMAVLLEQTHQPELQKAWDHFLHVVTAAKELNHTNGLLLQRLSSRNQNALAVIQGRQAPQLYGPDGQKGTRVSFRTTVG